MTLAVWFSSSHDPISLDRVVWQTMTASRNQCHPPRLRGEYAEKLLALARSRTMRPSVPQAHVNRPVLIQSPYAIVQQADVFLSASSWIYPLMCWHLTLLDSSSSSKHMMIERKKSIPPSVPLGHAACQSHLVPPESVYIEHHRGWILTGCITSPCHKHDAVRDGSDQTHLT